MWQRQLVIFLYHLHDCMHMWHLGTKKGEGEGERLPRVGGDGAVGVS